MTTPARPVLRYFGGKYAIREWAVENMPAHAVYVEPYGGAASVLMAKPRSRVEIYNDLDSTIVNVFRVLQKPDWKLLAEAVAHTPWSREEFELSQERSEDPVEDARRTIIRAYMSHGSVGATRASRSGFRSKDYIIHKPTHHTFREYPVHLESFNARLIGVILENRPALEVIDQHDSKETLFFVDPPYVMESRTSGGYRHEMNDADHRELIEKLSAVSGMVMLCGYESSVYEDLGWHKLTKAASTERGVFRQEVMWFNAAAWNAKPQAEMFGVLG